MIEIFEKLIEKWKTVVKDMDSNFEGSVWSSQLWTMKAMLACCISDLETAIETARQKR